MEPHHQIDTTLERLTYTSAKNRQGVEYLNLPCGFDIETSSVEFADGEKSAFMYIWMIGIGEGEPVYYGREWGELADTLHHIGEFMELNEERRLPIYVHNLAYEFQFMRHYFEWAEVFAVDRREPLRATTTHGIEFRDNLALSGYSLEDTAKNLTTRKVEKKAGDLDYSLTRHPLTPLTEREMGYCESDIQVVVAYIAEQMDIYGDVMKIPMTNTGRVRKYVRDACYYSNKNHKKSSKGKFKRYRQIMEDLTLEPEQYPMMKQAFMGGFTHANANYTGQVLTDIASIDFTSSYPSVMVAEQFPMSRFRPAKVRSMKKLRELCKSKAVIMEIKFENIRRKIKQDSYLSEKKCTILKGETMDNGRVHSADELAATITEIDLSIIDAVYEWDAVYIGEVLTAYKGYLPKPIVESILNLYQKKTTLKGVDGYETEYLLSKGMLNSVYGMAVTDIVKDNDIYETDEWQRERADIEEEIAEYNEKKMRFLYYPWGLWVTAYARRNLWSGILAVGEDYVYADTDSIKLKNYDSHSDYILAYNFQTEKKLRKACKHHGIDPKLLDPPTQKGDRKMLGVWDYEGTYSRFKTLGRKRYLVEEDGKLTITVAGLSKQKGIDYMKRKAGSNEAVFDMFNDSLYIPAKETGKLTHTYIDHEQRYNVLDYQGGECEVSPLSGTHLGPCEFTLSVGERYKIFLSMLMKGQLFLGTAYK